MFQANSKLTPNMVRMLLMYTAQQLPNFNTLEQGAGELNVDGAVLMGEGRPYNHYQRHRARSVTVNRLSSQSSDNDQLQLIELHVRMGPGDRSRQLIRRRSLVADQIPESLCAGCLAQRRSAGRGTAR